MYWIDEVKQNIKKKRQILFSKSSEILQNLQDMLALANKRIVVLWALSFAKEAVDYLNIKYPEEDAPSCCLEATKLWAAGQIKMPQAKKEILNCHALAKRLDSQEDIALCHAIGQACGSVHAKGHAIGFPIYELTAIVRKYGIEECPQFVEKRLQEYTDRLILLEKENKDKDFEWAKFLCR